MVSDRIGGTFQIVKEHGPARCEICHQSDQLDLEKNICLRCQSVLSQKSTELPESQEPNSRLITNSDQFEKFFPYFFTGAGLIATTLLYQRGKNTFGSISKRAKRLKKVLIAPCLFILSGGGLIFHQGIPAATIFPPLEWKVYSAVCDVESNSNSQINNRLIPQNPLALQVELNIDIEKKCFYQGEKINLRASIKNKTNSRLIIEKDHNYADKIIPLNNIALSLKNNLGESVSELDIIRRADRPSGWPIDETIEPSETYTHNFFINYLYNLTVPGIYVFRIEQDVRVETGGMIHLTSNQIHFRVIEDPSLLLYGKKKEVNVIPTSNNKHVNVSPFIPAFRFHLQSSKNLYSIEDSINIDMSLMNPEKKVIHVPGLQTLFPALDFEIYRSNGVRISSTPFYQYQVSHIPAASNEAPIWLPPNGNFSFPLQINNLFNFDKSDVYTMKVRLKSALPNDDIVSNQIQFTIQGRKW